VAVASGTGFVIPEAVKWVVGRRAMRV
jgi:hypothetical protein